MMPKIITRETTKSAVQVDTNLNGILVENVNPKCNYILSGATTTISTEKKTDIGLLTCVLKRQHNNVVKQVHP